MATSPADGGAKKKRRPKKKTKKKKRARRRGRPLVWAETPLADCSRADVADYLKQAAILFCYRRQMAACPEMGMQGAGVADVLGIRYNGDILIFEVKSCRADFQADRKWEQYLQYCNYFYFLTPQGVLDPAELPAGVGLYEVHEECSPEHLPDGAKPKRKPIARRLRNIVKATRQPGDTREHAWRFLYRMAERHTRYEKDYPIPPPELTALQPFADTPDWLPEPRPFLDDLTIDADE